MSNIFLKNFYHCFSQFKCSPMILPQPSPSNEDQNPPTHLIKKYHSIYDPISSDSTSKSLFSNFSENSSDSSDSSPPDFATVFASQRFFFSSPGSSNSILDPPPAPVDNSVAVQTYSSDPYSDFRRSMQEMVEARDVKSDWDFLHELLLSYLTLNPKQTHKFIISAFSDLIISLKIEDAATSPRLV